MNEAEITKKATHSAKRNRELKINERRFADTSSPANLSRTLRAGPRKHVFAMRSMARDQQAAPRQKRSPASPPKHINQQLKQHVPTILEITAKHTSTNTRTHNAISLHRDR